MTAKPLQSQTQTFNDAQLKATKSRFSRGDFGAAQASALKFAIVNQKTAYLFATCNGYQVTDKEPSLPSGQFYAFVPNGNTVTGTLYEVKA